MFEMKKKMICSLLAGCLIPVTFIPLISCDPNSSNPTEIEPKVTDNVTKVYTDAKTPYYDMACTFTIPGYTYNSNIENLNVEIINESHSVSYVTISLEAKIEAPNQPNSESTFRVMLSAYDIYNNDTITFDLKFTDKTRPEWEGYVSTGYSVVYNDNSSF